MMMSHKFLRVSAALMLAFAIGGCGVKSSPKPSEDSTYPRVYPAPPAETTETAPRARTERPRDTTDTRPSRTDSSGNYTPPPPATELLAK
ncbi:MAG: hypothetical protein ACFE0S_12015 [Rhodospirillales bacterium]